MKISLKKMKTDAIDGLTKIDAKAEIKKMIKKLVMFQEKMYADGNQSMLIVLQGLDASGKDGAINKILGPINPQGCFVKSFGVPTKEESAHDFLWRIHKQVPAKGMMTVFNRSHYEDLVMPLMNKNISDEEYAERVEQIKNFEKMLTQNGTQIVKVFFHVGKEKQKEKLEERLTDPTKHRKHKDSDREKAALYDEYMETYSKVLSDTDFGFAEWTIIGSDSNYSKEYEFAKIITKRFGKMHMEYPILDTQMHIIQPKNTTGKKEDFKKELKKEDFKKELKKEDFKKELKKEDFKKELKKEDFKKELKKKKIQKEIAFLALTNK